jgi:glucosamine-phosphate N-acetyltransferase
MDYIIRKISLDDYISYKTHIQSDVSFDFFSNFVNNILNNNHCILVIEKDSKIIGSGTLLIEEKMTYGGCKMGHIENIYIDESMRGKKYGSILVNELVSIAKNHKCYRIDLSCENHLIPFYKNIGFDTNIICMSMHIKENYK